MKYQTKPIIVDVVQLTPQTVDEALSLLPEKLSPHYSRTDFQHPQGVIEVNGLKNGNGWIKLIKHGEFIVKKPDGSIDAMSEKAFKKIYVKLK